MTRNNAVLLITLAVLAATLGGIKAMQMRQRDAIATAGGAENSATPQDKKRIHFVGLDTDDKVLAAIRDGAADATVAQNPYGHGYISTALLDLMLRGWIPKADYQFIDSGCLVVTQENVDNFQPGIEDVTRGIVAKLKTEYLSPPPGGQEKAIAATDANGKSIEALVLYSVLPHPYFTGVQDGGRALGKDSDIGVRLLTGQESTQANVNTNIESMLSVGYKAFSLYPVDPAGSKGLFARLKKAGCLAVAYGAQPEAGTECPFAVATDTKAAATMGTEKLIELMGGKGKILNVLESLTDANTPIRKAAIEAVVAKHPGVEIIQTVGDVTTEDAARAKIESALVARGGEIDGIICTGYTTTVAAATLLERFNGKKE